MKVKDFKLYVDMDGVLADFNAEPNAVERFKVEKGFFAKLKPIQKNVDAVKRLLEHGYDVCILTTSPHKKADKDKAKWLKKTFGKKLRAIYGRPSTAKIDYIKVEERAKSILFDDYGKNIREWIGGGGARAVKITPEHSILDEFARGY